MKNLCASLCLSLLLTCSAAAQKVNGQHAQVELLAEPPTSSGQIQFGVHFILEKGWHIYWINPGDSGQPPEFHWQLPPGFTAEAIQWPYPERMQNARMADYGYHDETLLLVPLHAPQNHPPKSSDITLDAKWLICREVCIPDHAQFHLHLPDGTKEDPAVKQLFNNARKLLPNPLPHAWHARAESLKEAFVLTIQSSSSVQKAEFFPLEPEQIENGATQNVHPLAKGVQITLRKSDQLLKPIAHLKGVVVLEGANAYAIDAPVIEKK
jgi:DsbC/DsbD-like thiol-disulfide interchange protein